MHGKPKVALGTVVCSGLQFLLTAFHHATNR